MDCNQVNLVLLPLEDEQDSDGTSSDGEKIGNVYDSSKNVLTHNYS